MLSIDRHLKIFHSNNRLYIFTNYRTDFEIVFKLEYLAILSLSEIPRFNILRFSTYREKFCLCPGTYFYPRVAFCEGTD